MKTPTCAPFACFYSNRGLNGCSLNCRHVYCGLCIAGWLARRHTDSCPLCRGKITGAGPQREVALSDVLLRLYAGLGRGVPNEESVDTRLFDRIREMVNNHNMNRAIRSQAETTLYWAPMIEEIERRRVFAAEAVPPPTNVIVVDDDEEMEVDAQDSDWESAQGVDPEEGGSEAGGAQNEDGVEYQSLYADE